jgi:hypothetical protein
MAFPGKIPAGFAAVGGTAHHRSEAVFLSAYIAL